MDRVSCYFSTQYSSSVNDAHPALARHLTVVDPLRFTVTDPHLTVIDPRLTVTNPLRLTIANPLHSLQLAMLQLMTVQTLQLTKVCDALVRRPFATLQLTSYSRCFNPLPTVPDNSVLRAIYDASGDASVLRTIGDTSGNPSPSTKSATSKV
nr:hypothetical protein CFP56_52934 [Quercus suber]